MHAVIPETTQVWMEWNILGQGSLRTYLGLGQEDNLPSSPTQKKKKKGK